MKLSVAYLLELGVKKIVILDRSMYIIQALGGKAADDYSRR